MAAGLLSPGSLLVVTVCVLRLVRVSSPEREYRLGGSLSAAATSGSADNFSKGKGRRTTDLSKEVPRGELEASAGAS